MTTSDKLCDVAVVGLGVMGANLARNFASRGLRVAVYNRHVEEAHALAAAHPEAKLRVVAEYAGLEVHTGYLGSCASGRLEDLRQLTLGIDDPNVGDAASRVRGELRPNVGHRRRRRPGRSRWRDPGFQSLPPRPRSVPGARKRPDSSDGRKRWSHRG